MVSYSDGIDEKNSFSPPVGLEDWPPLVPSEQSRHTDTIPAVVTPASLTSVAVKVLKIEKKQIILQTMRFVHVLIAKFVKAVKIHC
ncbi:hypothetical protein J6590_099301 [Homalodisca vitripennis]|nr:hypothetical protein J6590_099301 [Homalodisca vitripennis]